MISKIIQYGTMVVLLVLIIVVYCFERAESEQVKSEPFDKKDGVFVLCYHAFNDKPSDITFPIKQLNLHMETLKNAGFNFITTEDLIAQRYRGLNNVLITSDDGNASVWQAYHEVFKKYNIKPLLAIHPAIIGKRNFVLTWEQLAKLHKEGCYIAAHGYYHLFLDAAAYKKDPQITRNEVTRSKKLLESKGFDIDTFVYPYGSRCPEILKLVKETGYKYGFTIEPGMVYRNDPNVKLLEMPRYMITNSNVNQVFKLMFETIGKTYEPNPALVAFPKGKAKR